MANSNLFVGIDFETANSNPLSACSVGLVVFDAGEVIFEFESLIKPPNKYRDFAYFNSRIHKISKEDILEAMSWKEIYPVIAPYLDEALIVAHNARFDMKVLRSLNEYYDLHLPKANYFCSVDVSRQVLPYLINHKLNTVSEFLEINLNHHNAKSDALASAMIIYKCMFLTKTLKLEDLLKKLELKPKQLVNL